MQNSCGFGSWKQGSQCLYSTLILYFVGVYYCFPVLSTCLPSQNACKSKDYGLHVNVDTNYNLYTNLSIRNYIYHLDWSWIPSKLTHSAFPWWSYFLITANTQDRQDAVIMLFKFWTWRWKFIFWNISFVIRMQILSSLLDMFCIAQLSFDQTCLLDKLPVQ